MKTLQPFGDVPQKLTEQLRRSFVATRTFSQALMKGKQIIQRIVKVNIFIECLLNENIASTDILVNEIIFCYRIKIVSNLKKELMYH